ncbi:MAG: hypothetical protein ABIJ00_16050 [Candidatus Eisenbacteria bacterium]
MRKCAFTFSMLLTGFALFLPLVASADTPADSLWLRAVNLSEESKDLVPGTIESYMQETDKHGKPKDEDKYHHSWGKLSLRDDGEITYETVKVIKDGEDITEEEQAKDKEKQEEEDGKDSDGFDPEEHSPFDAETQDRLSIERLDETETTDGKDLAVYSFIKHPAEEDDEEVTGKAWFDIATGVPVKIEYTTDPLPKRVKRMVTTMEYVYSAPDTLVVGKMIMEATGGILFIKKHFHAEMTFADHWRTPEGYDE